MLTQTNFVSLLFTTQNNGVKGESIGHDRTGQLQGFPVAAMRHRVAYLRRHGATGEALLSSYNKYTKWQHIQGEDITAAIRAVVLAAGLLISFTEADISARYLRAGGGGA